MFFFLMSFLFFLSYHNNMVTQDGALSGKVTRAHVTVKKYFNTEHTLQSLIVCDYTHSLTYLQKLYVCKYFIGPLIHYMLNLQCSAVFPLWQWRVITLAGFP